VDYVKNTSTKYGSIIAKARLGDRLPGLGYDRAPKFKRAKFFVWLQTGQERLLPHQQQIINE
jgi:hypothetical protein